MQKSNEGHECVIDHKHAPIESFMELNIPDLKGHAAMKRADDVIDMKKFYKSMKIIKWPNKGTVEEALLGNVNLVKLAYESRNMSNKLKKVTFESLCPTKEKNESKSG